MRADNPSMTCPSRTLVKSAKPTALDSVMVFLTSLFIACGSTVPPYLFFRSLIRLVAEHRAIADAERYVASGANGEEIIPSEEIILRRSRWQRRAVGFAACAVAYALFVKTRASKLTSDAFKASPIWRSWMRYVEFELVDGGDGSPAGRTGKREQKILAISPHGLIPFPLALAAINKGAEDVWGTFRVVAASATKALPGLAYFIRTIIDGVDASRASVDSALASGDSVGVAPGGIEEMFQGFPKAGWAKDEEAVLLKSRKGFIRLAKKHDVPVVPVFCFGASKLMRRLDVPFMESLSKLLRASLVLVYGRLGLPVPFQTKLLYVMGTAIRPKVGESVDEMHERFCRELKRVFEDHKHYYNWERKSLRIV